MVQTEVPQLSKECNEWREQLHSWRDEFNALTKSLQQAAPKALTKDQQAALEHFQNQLHIQLINIHDVKQAVKSHDKKIQYEVSAGSQIADDTYTDHERLYEEYQSLEHSLSEFRSDFQNFVSGL